MVTTQSQFIVGPDPNQVAEVKILVDGGPLCVGPLWDWTIKETIVGLYFVYLKQLGLRFGPYYAEITLAGRDMKKALKAFPAGFWNQPLEWYQRQASFHKWIDENMGRPDDLIGAEWVKE